MSGLQSEDAACYRAWHDAALQTALLHSLALQLPSAVFSDRLKVADRLRIRACDGAKECLALLVNALCGACLD